MDDIQVRLDFGDEINILNNHMTDQEIVEKLIANDVLTIRDFFFVKCRGTLTYIGQYFCSGRQMPEELIGEFYEFLSSDGWHKLRIFKYTCSLKSYITIIASRYFQHKRDKELLLLDEDSSFIRDLQAEKDTDSFFMEDLNRIVKKMQPFDRFLVQRILIDGEKPGNILDEAKEFIEKDATIDTKAESDAQFSGYIYTRYNRLRKGLQKQMLAIGYGRYSN